MPLKELIQKLQEIDAKNSEEYEKVWGPIEVYVDAFKDGKYIGLSHNIEIAWFDLGIAVLNKG